VSDLSILCVSRGEEYARPFLNAMHDLKEILKAELIVLLDRRQVGRSLNGWVFQGHVESAGYIESVLDEALKYCTREYVLRLDDDERCSKGMVEWLAAAQYEEGQHWKFERAHLWGDTQHVLMTPHLWPDYQTRLSWRQYAGGRSTIHEGSPHGGGVPAHCAIEHWKFLVRTLEERREIVTRYDAIQPGAGSRFRAFSCPEDFYAPDEIVAAVRRWDGRRLEP
jgi:hypothetical protein